MATLPYLGTYGRFHADEATNAAVLMGADTLIGDPLTYEITHENGATKVVISNRFDGRVGVLDAQTAGMVELCRAKEWDVRILLASLYQKHSEDHELWGEVVLISFPQPKTTVFETFVENVGNLLGEGIRVEVDLAQGALNQLEESGGTWLPQGRRPALKDGGSSLVKSRLSMNEKLVELARKRNPGCMAAGWLFIAALVFLALYVGKLLLGL